MKSVKQLLIICLTGAIIAGCTKATYRKTEGGMPYQLYKGGDTQRIYAGNIIKVNFTQKVNDSVYFTNVGLPPLYTPVNAVANPYDVSEIWTKINVGDSIVAIQMMDTFIKRNPQNFPKQFKRGDRIKTYVKVLGVFLTDSAATNDETREKNKWKENEIVALEKHLADKKINTQKTPSGAYVEIINQGTGNLVDSGKYISVNYTGTSFSGKRFDSNTDTSFHHVEPYSFIAGTGQMIKGFDEAVMFLRKGGSAKVYIPSMLGYGANPGTPLIKPYENLIFDIEIVDIKDKAPTRADMEAAAKKMAEEKKIDTPQPKK